MFTQDPENCTIWDVCQSVQPTTHDINQGILDTLVVPPTILSDADFNHFIAIDISLWQH